MAASPPPRDPGSLRGILIPLLQVSGIVLWLLELAAVAVTVLLIPSLEAMHRDLGSKLPQLSVHVFNVGHVARSWPGLAVLLALLGGSLLGYWKARQSYTYWTLLTLLKVAALLWLCLWMLAMFVPVMGTSSLR